MNSRGFGLLSFVCLLPAILTIVGVVSAGALVIKADSKLKHECRLQLLESQTEIASRLNKLISLNPKARRLIQERKAADRAFRLAPPVAKPAAAVVLGLVKAQQYALKFEQQALILPSKSASQSTPWTTYRSLGTKAAQDSFSKLAAGTPSLRSGRFAIQAIQPSETAPEYKTLPDFSESQTMKVEVDFPIANFLPEWLKPFLKRTDLKLRTTCSATLEKENGKWIAKLKADKS